MDVWFGVRWRLFKPSNGAGDVRRPFGRLSQRFDKIAECEYGLDHIDNHKKHHRAPLLIVTKYAQAF